MIASTALLGAAFGTIWALLSYLATRGQRDFSSVRAVVATRYEVLVEHKLLAKAQESPSAVAQARRRNRVNHSVTEARSASVVHNVKPGETLWSIARAYQTTAEAIRSTNKYLFSRPLEVGDSLTILAPR